MLHQKLRNIRNFFFSGRKSILTTGATENDYRKNVNNTEGKVKILYHRDFDSNDSIAEFGNAKAETMQHNWWIN